MGECSEPSFGLISQDVLNTPAAIGNENDDTAEILDQLVNGSSEDDEEMGDACKDDWLPLDEDLLSAAMNGGVERSRNVNAWARKRFDEWRKAFNIDMSLPIEKLELRDMNNLLSKFIIQVKKKKDRKLYPPSSLSSLFRAIGRIIRREQEKRIGMTGVREPPFNILTDPVFSQSREAFVGMMRKTRVSGNYDRPKKKAPCISFTDEAQILADIDHQITHPMGCIKRLVYYMLMRFGIRGVKELHRVKDCDLVLEKDDVGELVKYGERISKNNAPTATKFDDHHFRQPIWTYEKDFVLTFKQYFRHLPPKEKDSEPRPLFLQPISKPRFMAWYAVSPVGIHNLGKWLNTMASVLGPETSICNKSGRVSLVSRLCAKGITPDLGMKITGHKSAVAYEKYDRTRESKINACMDVIAHPTSDPFSKVLSDQISRQCLTDISNVPSSSSTVLHVSDFINTPGQEENMNPEIHVDHTPVCTSPVDISATSAMNTLVKTSAPAAPINTSTAAPVNSSPPPVKTTSTVVNNTDTIGETSAGHELPASNAILSTISCLGDVQVVKKDAGLIFQQDDDFDDSFYSELSKSFPESAKAIGKFMAPTISNQGTFNGCTFNFGVDSNVLLEALSAALKKGSAGSSNG